MGLIGTASPQPSLLYRAVRRLFSLVGRLLFRIEVEGLENLPRDAAGHIAGGWICCGLPHRTWAEPFVLMFILPARPRLMMLGEGRTALGSPWRRFLVRRVGGVVPIWPGAGASGFRAVTEAVRRVIEAGAIFALFPETGRPARPPALRRLSPGIAHMARHCRAPVVPFVFGGTHELYLRRRIVVRVLPPLRPPPPDADARALAAFMDELVARAERASAAVHTAAEIAAPRLRLWRWLTGPFPRAD